MGGVNVFARIIVPLDGSRLSAQAVPYASEFAKRFNAEIILVPNCENMHYIIHT